MQYYSPIHSDRILAPFTQRIKPARGRHTLARVIRSEAHVFRERYTHLETGTEHMLVCVASPNAKLRQPLRLILGLLILLALAGCGPTRSSDLETHQLEIAVSLSADYGAGIADVTGTVTTTDESHSSDSVRLVDGDRLIIRWDEASRTLYRRQSELYYAARLPTGQSNTLNLALLRKNSERRDALDTTVVLPDVQSFRIDEALQTVSVQSTLTLRWNNDPAIPSSMAPEATATVLSCVDTFGVSASDSLLSIPASRMVLPEASGSAQINLANLLPVNSIADDIAQCEWGIRLSLSSDTVQSDPALASVDVSATLVSTPIRVTVDYTSSGAGS